MKQLLSIQTYRQDQRNSLVGKVLASQADILTLLLRTLVVPGES